MDSADDQSTMKRFVTRGGTAVEFEGGRIKETITVKTGDGACLEIQEDNKNMILRSGGASITLDGTCGKIIIEANSVSIKGLSIQIESAGELLLKGTQGVLECTGNLSIQSEGLLTLHSPQTGIN